MDGRKQNLQRSTTRYWNEKSRRPLCIGALTRKFSRYLCRNTCSAFRNWRDRGWTAQLRCIGKVRSLPALWPRQFQRESSWPLRIAPQSRFKQTSSPPNGSRPPPISDEKHYDAAYYAKFLPANVGIRASNGQLHLPQQKSRIYHIRMIISDA